MYWRTKNWTQTNKILWTKIFRLQRWGHFGNVHVRMKLTRRWWTIFSKPKKAWIPTRPTEQSIPLPPANMEVKTWKCSSYLSNTAGFHIHDKIQSKKHLTTPTVPWPDTIFLQKRPIIKGNKKQHQSCQCGETLPKNIDFRRKMSFSSQNRCSSIIV